VDLVGLIKDNKVDIIHAGSEVGFIANAQLITKQDL
jgi:hypothetical protein